MDYEKLHKDTITKLQEMVNSGKITVETACGICADFVPESEDEKIRKALLNDFKNNCSEYFCAGINRDMVIAWLEKQGEKGINGNEREIPNSEQKPADKIEPKFEIGDWVFIEEVKGYKNGPFQIKTMDSFGYSFDEYHTIPFMYEDLFSNWTIQDAKDGDILFQDLMGGKTFIYNGINPDMAILYSFIISNDGKDVLPYHIGKPNTGIGNIEENKNIIYPATKEQRDLLFQKMKEAGYEWDAENKKLKKISQRMISAEAKEALYDKPAWSEEDDIMANDICYALRCQITYPISRLQSMSTWINNLKDRVQLQPKQEWSEEDEKILNSLISSLTRIGASTRTNSTSINYTFSKEINWLKSIKPQNRWKPSEEMLEALYRAVPQNVKEKSEDEILLDKLYQGLKYGRVISNN